ncbi:hypothetical protein [Burkholderia lata]|uniref:Uncharacterized protein n=1 Tax=Burkholderia lata (strain ATCC 17760 / DSM 23089 / LMG 22485 / NCIMB 9086 / R18194 / 383) TaxID=482957 RepID=A0A6P2Q3N9_BURL3|nr:hypothetical protein [Burkholderia lata]VWC17048.1 hypothetical protein BLA6863_05659 [Burkholderia lata]
MSRKVLMPLRVVAGAKLAMLPAWAVSMRVVAVEIPVDAGRAADTNPIALPRWVTTGHAQERVPLSAMSVVIEKTGNSTSLVAINAD